MKTNLLITGRPGSGKTTLIRRIAEHLPEVRTAGFYTAEIRESGRRAGFELVSLDGRRQVLAHVAIGGPRRVSRYGVDLEGFEAFLEPVPFFSPGTDLIVIDEIGKMEWFSERFREIVRGALDAPVPCVATIARRGGGGIDRIRERADVEIIEVTRGNRDDLMPALLERVRHLLAAARQE